MKIKEKKHSELSASGSDRWLNCPGSVSLSRGIPPQDNQWSVNGTIAHDLLEKKLKNEKYDINNYNREMHNAVNFCIKYIENILKINPGEMLVEKKVSLNFICPDMFGTLDIAIISKFDILQIWDFKFGTSLVKPRGDDLTNNYNYNTQLIYYALGVAHEYDYDFASVRLGILQPRITYKPASYADLKMGTLLKYKYIFKKGVSEVYKPKPKLKSGPWCKWCLAFSRCPIQENVKSEKIANLLSDFEI